MLSLLSERWSQCFAWQLEYNFEDVFEQMQILVNLVAELNLQ